MLSKSNWHFAILGVITIINFIFAFCLDLYADEAYYWMYSEFLDWGYFDHPPAVGAVIKLGYLIFEHEIGVRLFFVIATSLSYHFLYTLTRPKNEKLFWLVSMSFFPLHLMGFMALPDILVFLFCILFMHAYRRYLADHGIVNVLLVAISIAAMIYSKYHGLIFVFFVVISNFKLLTKPSFYLITVIVLVLLVPHVVWQVDHEYASLKYHFIERSSRFKFSNIVDYILGFIFYNGPLVFIALLVGIVPMRSKDVFDRSMKFLLYGFFIFFLISSLKGRVEANWTFFAILPAVYLGMKSKIAERRILKYLSVVSIGLIMLFRVYLLFPFGNLKGNRAMEFHGHQAFADKVKSVSGDRPIVAARYQTAGILSFYLKEHVTSVNLSSRKNQFDFWGFADDWVNRPYAEAKNYLTKGTSPIDSVDHLFLGKHYISLKDSLQLVRYPKIGIDNYKVEKSLLSIEFSLKSENLIQGTKPMELDYELSYESGKKNVVTTAIDKNAINERITQFIEIPLGTSEVLTGCFIHLKNHDGLIWTTKKLSFD